MQKVPSQQCMVQIKRADKLQKVEQNSGLYIRVSDIVR